MKNAISMVVLLVAATGAITAQAADSKLMMPISAAMEANDAQARLSKVKLYFAGQRTPKVTEKMGSDKTSQKTNSFGKSPETACNWAFLSAMLALQKRAEEMGADAVVNIVSNYKNVETASATEFECHEGRFVSGVAFKGDFVRLGGKK